MEIEIKKIVGGDETSGMKTRMKYFFVWLQTCEVNTRRRNAIAIRI